MNQLFTILVIAFVWTSVLSGCGREQLSPRVVMQLATASAGGDTVRFTAVIRNIGDGVAKYDAGFCTLSVRFLVYDKSGNQITITDPCQIEPAAPCFRKIEDLEPGEHLEFLFTVTGQRWPDRDSCVSQQLPADNYRAVVQFHFETDATGDTEQIVEKDLWFHVPPAGVPKFHRESLARACGDTRVVEGTLRGASVRSERERLRTP